MNCPSCGAQVDDNARFCENCGAALVGVAATDETVEIPPSADQAATQEIPNPQGETVEIPAPQGDPVYDAPFQPQVDATAQMPQSPAPPTGAPANASVGDTAPLVLGILSIVFAGLVGLILSIIGLNKSKKVLEVIPDSGKAKAGKICSIIGLVMSIIGFVVAIVILIVTLIAAPNIVTIDIGSSSSYSMSSTKSSSVSSKSTPSSTSSSTKSAPSKSSSSSKPAATSSTYSNARFGYSLNVPAGFEKTAESANGDGATFYNSKLKMTAYAAGYNNSNGLTPERIIETKWNGTSDSMSESDDSQAMLYQIEGNEEVFYYWYVGAGSINELTIKYPKQDNNSDELDAAESLIMGFEPGSIAATH